MEAKANFCKERRDLLKSGCALAGTAALVTVGGSVNAFAAGGRGTQPQPVGSPERYDLFVFADGPKKGQEVKTDDIVQTRLRSRCRRWIAQRGRSARANTPPS